MTLEKHIKTKPIRVISIDHTVVYNKDFLAHYDEYEMVRGSNPKPANDPAVQANRAFLKNYVRRQNEKYSKNIIMNGSMLQSRDSMARACKHYGIPSTLTDFLDAMSAYAHVEKDEFMLADVYGDKYPGYSYLAASKPEYDSKEYNFVHPKAHEDETLVTVLYAQMHKLANDYPNEPISFEYISADANVLDALQEFFEENKDLIPTNIKLQLVHNYKVSEINDEGLEKFKSKAESYKPIVGKGMIDINYYETVKKIHTQLKTMHVYNSAIAQAKPPSTNKLNQINRLETKPKEKKKLKDVVNSRILSGTRTPLKPEDIENKKTQFNLDKQLKAVVKKGARYANRNNIKAQRAVMKLHDKLHESVANLNAWKNVTPDALDKFVKDADEAIDKAHKEITQSSAGKKMGMFNPVEVSTSHTLLFKKLKQDIREQVEVIKGNAPSSNLQPK